MPKKIIIFDLDGVLVDTKNIHFEALKLWIKGVKLIKKNIKIKKSLLIAVDDELSIDDLKKTDNLFNKLNVNQIGIIENFSENFQLGDKPILSKRIQAEFPNHKILFSLPRVT